MHAEVTTQDIALRLLAAVIAGALLGLNRGRRGRVAGLRTTILTCLAATGAMITANLMLAVDGKTASSFTMMDALRFPLGILTGIGFIGAGAILKKGSIIKGVTTAATIWLVTVIGLALGAGYLLLGGAMVAVALVVLVGLGHVETSMVRDHSATLILDTEIERPSDDELRRRVTEAGYRIALFAVTIRTTRLMRLSLNWKARESAVSMPTLVRELSATDGIYAVVWEPQDAEEHE